MGWAFKLAWRFNKWILITWSLLVSTVSILPAVALYYNRTIITELDSFLTTGNGSFIDILPIIIMFGNISMNELVAKKGLYAEFFNEQAQWYKNE